MPEVFNNEVLCKHVIKIPLPDYMLNLVETVVITGRNEVVAMVIFLHLSFILFTGGVCLSACWDTTTPPRRPPGADTPQSRHTPHGTPLGPDTPRNRDQTPPGTGTTPSPGSRLQHTIYKRPVRILFECILLLGVFVSSDMIFRESDH